MKTMRSIYHRALTIGLVFSALMLGAPEGARGAEFRVPPGAVDMLISAIIDANNEVAYPGRDTIVLGAGTYALIVRDMTAPPEQTNGAIGLPSITSQITIVGADDPSNSTDIDATIGPWRVFRVADGGSLELNRLTIRRGRPSPLDDIPLSGDGGGILNGGELVLNNSIIVDNRANHGSGGGILNFGRASLKNSTIQDNAAGTFGGGINSFSGELTLDRSTVRHNSAGLDGGGVDIGGGEAKIFHSTISDNTAGRFGGGITNSAATLTVINSTISDNAATGVNVPEGAANGGGIANLNSGTVNLNNVTITLNFSAPRLGQGFETLTGMGLFNQDGSTFNIANTILAENNIPGGCGNCSECNGQLTSRGFNIIGTRVNCGIDVISRKALNTDILLDVSLNTLHVRLGPLANNGGSTETHALLSGSPAIDAGPPVLTDDFSFPTGTDPVPCQEMDQRNLFRAGAARNGQFKCDIGAFELGATETKPPPCSDGLDNDKDGRVDYPADRGCSSPTDVSEVNPECSNDKDDDKDGRVDYPADPGCSSPTDISEDPDPPQCSNGKDDDGDRKVDLMDPGCASPNDNSESPDPPPMQFTFNCFLKLSKVLEGNFYYSPRDRVCGGGFQQGTVISIRNTALFSIAFVKLGRSTTECGKSEAVVVLDSGKVFGATEMQQLFGTPSPRLPITPYGCPRGVSAENLPDTIALDIVYRGSQ